MSLCKLAFSSLVRATGAVHAHHLSSKAPVAAVQKIFGYLSLDSPSNSRLLGTASSSFICQARDVEPLSRVEPDTDQPRYTDSRMGGGRGGDSAKTEQRRTFEPPNFHDVRTGKTIFTQIDEDPARQKYVAKCRDAMKLSPGGAEPSFEDRIRWAEIPKKEKAAMSEVPIWKSYRRRYAGQFSPKYPRNNCRRGDNIKNWASNPCPLCQIIMGRGNPSVTHKDVLVLNQFINPTTNEILPTSRTGVCRKQQITLLAAVEKARDFGYLQRTLPKPTMDAIAGLPRKLQPVGIPKGRRVKLSGVGKRQKQRGYKQGVFKAEPI